MVLAMPSGLIGNGRRFVPWCTALQPVGINTGDVFASVEYRNRDHRQQRLDIEGE